MMIRVRRRSGLGLMMSGLFSLSAAFAPAMAAPVTFQFGGHLTSVDRSVTIATGFTIGHTFTGTYTFESTTPDDHSSPSVGDYREAVTNVTVTINSVSVNTHNPFLMTSSILVADNSNLNGDVYSLSTLDNPLGLIPDLHIGFIGLSLIGGSGSALDGDSLSIHPPSLASFATKQATFTFTDGAGDFGTVQGSLTSLSAVPLPAAALLYGIGLAALAGLGWRCRRSPAVQAVPSGNSHCVS